jgi:hypothetical protein
MSIIKNITAGLAVSGLLLSSAAYASETRSDASVAPKASVQTLTLASASKLKRRTAPLASFSSYDSATNDALFLLGGAAIGAGACAAIPCATKTKSPGT